MSVSGRPHSPARRATALRCNRARAVAALMALTAFAAGTARGDAAGEEPAVGADRAARLADALALPVTPPEEPADPTGAAQSGYVDQYLFEGDLPGYSEDEISRSEPFGQRLVATELIYYRSDDDLLGDESERGARAVWRRETLNWGVIDAETQFSAIDSDYANPNGRGTEAIFTFRQSAMPISDVLTLNNTFGHHRTGISSLLHSGYRYRLPSSPLFGASTELTGIDRSLRFTTGKTGVYRGVSLPDFEETGGRLTALAYEQRVKDDFDVGGEVARVEGDPTVRDHTSLLLAGRYSLPDGSQVHAARVLTDDDGNLGLWTDSYQELRSGPTVRYGAFYFAPDLRWTDEPIASDQTGLYLRGDIDKFLYTLSGGYDYLQTGMGSGSLSSSRSHSTFFTGNLRASRDLSLGLSGNLALRDFSGGIDDDNQVAWRINSFANLHTQLGGARLEFFSGDLNSKFDANSRTQRGLWTSFDWRLPENLRLTNELRIEWNDDMSGDTRRDEVSALMRYGLFDNLSFGLNVSLYRTDGDSLRAENGYSLNADARWAFLRNWFASLSLNCNTATYDIDASGLLSRSETSRSNSVWLTFGYSRASGQPYQTFGRANGLAGTGRVSGLVFFDENRDSIRQPTERAAAGVSILLDGRYEARTDSQGRYVFAPVPTGRHEIRLLTEDVPLPWGLEDETAQPIEIGFRREANIVFPLQQLN